MLTNFQSSTLAGDFNRDGSVDAADYVVWRRHLSGNSFVDTANYQTWRANFGRTSPELAELHERSRTGIVRARSHDADRRVLLTRARRKGSP